MAHRRRRRLRRGRLALGGALVLLLAVVGFFVHVYVKARADHLSLKGELVAMVGQALTGGDAMNILLIGNNARDATSPLTPGQADLIIVAHVEPSLHRAVLITIPRNVMVAYPGWRDPIPKVKSAFLMGGPSLAMRTVSALTGLPVDHYVVADFQGFAAAIDAVGGVTVDIPARIYDPLHSGANFEPGVQRLDGAQALAWIRVRQNEAGNGYRVNDFQRMDAAVALLKALERQVVARMSPGEIGRLIGIWDRDVATDLSKEELAGLALSLAHARIEHITLGSLADSMDLMGASLAGVNAEGSFEGAYYDILTPGEISRQLAPLDPATPTTGLPPLPPLRTLQVAVTDDAAGRVLAAALRRKGVQASVSLSVPKAAATTVLYPPGGLLEGMALGRAVGQGSEVVEEGPVPGLEVETD